MAGGRVTVVEALTILLITVVVMLVVEVTLGSFMDQMAATLATVVVPGMNQQAAATFLGLFKQVHLVVGILILATAIWVIRVIFFANDYSRGRW